MRNKLAFWILLSISGVLSAAERSVILFVPGMSCPVCPITVKKSLQKVDGVKSVNILYESKAAEVSFDDKVTDINSLMKATENAGYPSQLKEDKK
ncbi:mercury resistance system periplasmic binding protein MerP [Candidatus Methylobacter favarea]|uniref:mercury resistance system periplasmic binding protein MerP n=1 Tax=Candidatus Methylobacter favarea TaxID=2707345 RepID=UPI00157D578E|nr:mercury resistance system periplasmic binding protein MerP [Candidatus Methylobacter favarea]